MVFKSSAWLIAGAVLATAGVAHAQESTNPTTEATATREAVPWYQRFTTTNGLTESITGDTQDDRILPPAWTLNQRWGITVDVREAARIERSPEGGRGNQTALGAYYQFTPSIRVGGEVSLETSRSPNAVAPVTRQEQDSQPAAGVRVESAFRF